MVVPSPPLKEVGVSAAAASLPLDLNCFLSSLSAARLLLRADTRFSSLGGMIANYILGCRISMSERRIHI